MPCLVRALNLGVYNGLEGWAYVLDGREDLTAYVRV